MPDSLDAVLAADSDDGLCAGLVGLLKAHHGDPADPAALPPQHRTVLLVWQSQEAIGAGGFNGFFSKDLPGDPDYRHTRAAYEAVGCEPAAAAVRRVFDAFPNHTPPADPRARVQMFGKANHAAHGALNRDFLKAQPALVAALAKYIRDHAAEFVGVDRPGGARPAPPPSADTSDEPDPEDPTALPLWARAAFDARCARQVLPLWEEAWPAAPPEYRQVVERAIELVEQSAAEARPVGDLKTAAAHVARVVAAALAHAEGRPTPDPPPDNPQRAALIAATAGSALDRLTGADDAGAYPVAKAVTEEAGLDDLLEDVRDDFARIAGFARENEWPDRTPVPPEVFDPSYKPTDRRWWKRWRG